MSEDEKEHLQREKEADEARKTEFNVGLVRHHSTHSLGHRHRLTRLVVLALGSRLW